MYFNTSDPWDALNGSRKYPDGRYEITAAAFDGAGDPAGEPTKIHVIVRAAYLADVPDLHAVGADRVFSGEGEVALGMTEYVLSELGATPDQIDRERARVHGELF